MKELPSDLFRCLVLRDLVLLGYRDRMTLDCADSLNLLGERFRYFLFGVSGEPCLESEKASLHAKVDAVMTASFTNNNKCIWATVEEGVFIVGVSTVKRQDWMSVWVVIAARLAEELPDGSQLCVGSPAEYDRHLDRLQALGFPLFNFADAGMNKKPFLLYSINSGKLKLETETCGFFRSDAGSGKDESFSCPDGFAAGKNSQSKEYLLNYALQRIDDEIFKDYSLEKLASELGILPARLSRLLNSNLGCGFAQLVAEKRIEKAKTLLAENNISIKEVSYSCGYRDPNYFTKVFKRVTGLSPKGYSQNMLLHNRPAVLHCESS